MSLRFHSLGSIPTCTIAMLRWQGDIFYLELIFIILWVIVHFSKFTDAPVASLSRFFHLLQVQFSYASPFLLKLVELRLERHAYLSYFVKNISWGILFSADRAFSRLKLLTSIIATFSSFTYVRVYKWFKHFLSCFISLIGLLVFLKRATHIWI